MDEVQIWQRALTGKEIKTLTSQSLSGNEDGLAAYYHLDEGQGKIVRDASTWGRDGKLRGAPNWTLARNNP
jgi:hypothetical protein